MTAAPLMDLAAAEFNPDSSVVEVVVYRSHALVTRAVTVNLVPGEHRIVLEEIPSVADPDSIRVSGSGAPGTSIGGVDVRQRFRPPTVSGEGGQLRTEIGTLTSQLGLLEDRKKSITILRDFLSGLKATAALESSKDLLARGFAVDSWQHAFDFLSARLNGLAEEERGQDVRRTELTEKLDVARRKLEQIDAHAGIQRWAATVRVSATQAGDFDLRISYLVREAGWRSLYDARLEPATGRIRIDAHAQVAQKTGEDWEDVAVTLSTTLPGRGIDLPRLASLILAPDGDARAETETTFSSEFIGDLPILGRNYQDVLTLLPGVVGETKPGYTAAEVAKAAASRRETAVVFELPGHIDIPGDGQLHKFPVTTRELEGKLEHHAAPAIAPGVILAARMTLLVDLPLLAGPVHHFVGADLVGASRMAELTGGEEFSLSFGPDDRLKTDRRRLLRRLEQRGKDDVIEYHFLTTVENHAPGGKTVILEDRIPVSSDERIVVTPDEDVTTRGYATDPTRPGVLTWDLALSEGGKQEVHLRYTVRAPRGLPISGLE